MQKVIGIISYLPDDKRIRENRLFYLYKLISTSNTLFNLPIYIVIQNYNEQEIANLKKYTNIQLSPNYTRLGIVGARKELRKWFLESTYDTLIMLDDDCVIYGNKEDGDKYLSQIDNNPDMFYEFGGTLLKLFAISKSIFKEVDFENLHPENGEVFEDRIFVEKLRRLFPEKRYIFERGKLWEGSVSTRDPNSTWYVDQDIKKMLENTRQFFEKC